jgi:hypothetical protein
MAPSTTVSHVPLEGLTMTDQTELLPLAHTPIRPPRAGTPGEGIFLDLWQELMATRPTLLDQIFADLPFVTNQRAASVAATFMVWMGCNCGRDFTEKAERYAKESVFGCREAAFRAAWANSDQRHRGVNSGLRTSEYMLAEQYPIDDASLTRGSVIWGRVPAVPMEDRDVLEAMVAWWASTEAREIRSIAAPLIDGAERRYWSKLFPRDAGQLVA